jgi:hypothetical protein
LFDIAETVASTIVHKEGVLFDAMIFWRGEGADCFEKFLSFLSFCSTNLVSVRSLASGQRRAQLMMTMMMLTLPIGLLSLVLTQYATPGLSW